MKRCLIYIVSAFIIGSLSCSKIDPDSIKPSVPGINELLQLTDLPFHQSFAVYGDFALFQATSNDKLYSYIYYLPNLYLCSKTELKTGGYSLPHANVSCFGKRFYSKDSLLPLLYVSQWNWKGERGVLVYDIKSDFSAELVQFISPAGISKSVIGSGDIDWIVDFDSEVLYALAYKKAGASTIVEGNEEIITSFPIPEIDRKTVILEEKDIIDNYRCKILNYSQDKVYKDGKIYIVAGGNDSAISFMNRMYVLDLVRKQIREEFDITGYALGISEPEGLGFWGDRLIMTYAKRPYQLWECTLFNNDSY